MAALGHTVDSGSGASGNYVSLNALEAAQEQDLTDGGGDTYTATCTTTGDNAADTPVVLISGWTTGAANYISIEAASTDRAVAAGLDTNKYRLAPNSGAASVGIDCREEYVRFDGLQIIVEDFSTSIGVYARLIGTSEIRVSGCRIESGGVNTTYGININDTDTTAYIWNNIVYKLNIGIYVKASAAAYVYNNTVYGNSLGIARQGGTVDAVNNVSFKNGTDLSGTYNLIDYNASDDNTGTNNVAESGGGVEWPDDFVDAAAGDFTLKSGSNLVGGGTDNPGSGLYSDDIEGTERSSPWDVGAFEFVAAGGGIVVLRRRRM